MQACAQVTEVGSKLTHIGLGSRCCRDSKGFEKLSPLRPEIHGTVIAVAGDAAPRLDLSCRELGAVVATEGVHTRGCECTQGIHFFRSVPTYFGDAEGGREFPEFQFQLWREDPAFLNFEIPWTIAGQTVHENGVRFFFMFVLLVVGVLIHKNLLRSRTGRAWQSIRDRDIAAEVMGIAETRYKTLAFAISSGFAGAAGALLSVIAGNTNPEVWDLNLSVEMIAIVLIGGAGTTAGVLLGALFVVILPEVPRVGRR